jgi:16S rRNA (cytidine1402-2'-O)-methyltransferase
LKPGILYIVATPIGNLEDISQRALRILTEVALIAAEDTRHSKKLLQHFGIKTKMISLHEHNERERSQELLSYLQAGDSVALISDAGTPLISDPGHHLVVLVHKNNIPVVPIPGPCAAIVALSAASISPDRFVFEGFLSAKSSQRKQHLEELQNETRTLIFYEAPHRIQALVNDLLETFGQERYVVLARELTKTYETIHGATLAELKIWLENNPEQRRGEFVVLIQGAESQSAKVTQSIPSEKILEILLAELPVKQAVGLAMKITGEKRNVLYKLALGKRSNFPSSTRGKG